MQLDFRIETLESRPLSLVPIANMGLADEIAEDNRGGWTDQGPHNDLRQFKPGRLMIDDIAFRTVEPAKNNGRAVLVLAGTARGPFRTATRLPLPAGNTAGAVNLLHASAWTPAAGEQLGEIVAGYTDGSEEKIPVVSRRDCGNWWYPIRGSNAAIGWRANNPESQIGLYASSFALKRPGPVSLDFRVNSASAMWMIVAVTLTDRPVLFREDCEREIVLKENSEWKPLTFRREVVKGSALDFSFLQDAPAGKYGPVTAAPDGTLTFERAPEKRLRLYGANLSFSSSFVDKATADHMVEYFVRMGYNSIRIHHHDTELLDRNAEDSLTFDPEKLDRLDYLFFRLKEAGIYVTTDLYTNRNFKPGDGIAECTFFDQRQMKMLIPLSRGAMENWKEFTRRWMTHRNPYTGLTWAEDPALWCVNLINEETLTVNWNKSPQSVKLYEQAFRNWCREKRLPESPASNINAVFRRFLQQLQDKTLAEQIDFTKNTLKQKALITSLNFHNDIPLVLMRNRFDLVDNHSYFDHPRFTKRKWSLPYSYSQASAISRIAHVPRSMMPTRIFGKPFIVTEFNFCSPNRFRAESGPLIGAYAALQNWDGVYRFAWSHNAKVIEQLSVTDGFDTVNDPLAQFSDRIALMMFRRGDVSMAEQGYAWEVPPQFFDREGPITYPAEFQNLGLIARIGSVVAGSRLPENVIPFQTPLRDRKLEALWNRANRDRVAESATGQLRLDAKRNTFLVRSPRSETVTLNSGNLAAGTLRVRNADSFQTVAALSLDGKPLAESASVLVFQLTEVANTGMTFSNGTRTILNSWGKLPLLVRRGAADVELATGSPFRVTALTCDGAPHGEVKGEYVNGIFRFRASTFAFPGGVLAYHLTRP